MKSTTKRRLAYAVLSTYTHVDGDGDLHCRHCGHMQCPPAPIHAQDCVVREAAEILRLDNPLGFDKTKHMLGERK